MQLSAIRNLFFTRPSIIAQVFQTQIHQPNIKASIPNDELAKFNTQINPERREKLRRGACSSGKISVIAAMNMSIVCQIPDSNTQNLCIQIHNCNTRTSKGKENQNQNGSCNSYSLIFIYSFTSFCCKFAACQEAAKLLKSLPKLQTQIYKTRT